MILCKMFRKRKLRPIWYFASEVALGWFHIKELGKTWNFFFFFIFLPKKVRSFWYFSNKNVFSPNSSFQNYFIRKIGWYKFVLLYLWAKYELIWSDITALTVNLGANLLFKAKNTPQNTHWELFIWSKVAFVQDN